MLHLFEGNWARARSLVDYWMNVPGTEVAMLFPWAVASSAWALAEIGETDEALNRVREGERLLEVQAARGIVGHRAWGYHAVSRASLLLGRLDDARRLGRCSVESAPRQPGFTAHALRLLGDLATHPDQFDAETGAAHYQQALALAQLHGMRPLAAHCRLGLGKLYDRIGQPEHARENMVAATTLYREMDMHFWLDAGADRGTLAI